MDHLKHVLSELGFSQKEAEVYLAMLELGPANVQEISERAHVNRTTAYDVLEHLKSRLMISTSELHGKTLFVPEHPQRLIALVVDESNKVQEKQKRVEQALPHLSALFNVIQGKPKVRYFEGSRELQLIREELRERGEEVWEVFAVDEDLVEVAKVGERERIEITSEIKGRNLIAIKPGCTPPYFDRSGLQVRTIDYDKYPFSGDITLCGQTLYIVTNKMLGIVIESPEVAGMFRSLFDAVWQTAQPWTAPDDWGRPF